MFTLLPYGMAQSCYKPNKIQNSKQWQHLLWQYAIENPNKLHIALSTICTWDYNSEECFYYIMHISIQQVYNIIASKLHQIWQAVKCSVTLTVYNN